MQVHTLPTAATLTAAAVPQVQPALQAAITALPAGAQVQLDISGVAAFDSAGLALLLACRRLAVQQAKSLVVTSWPAGMQSLAQAYGVWELLAAAPAAQSPLAT